MTDQPLKAGSMKVGFVSLLGRPNAGKSTLLNRIVGHKLAIVSDKPQTTRHRILGVRNYEAGEPEAGQVVFVDTPGVHKPTHRMNVRMVDAALQAMREVDLVTLVVDVSVKPGPGDEYLLGLLKDVTTPVILALNKVDRIAKPALLPIMDRYHRARPFAEIVPISASDGTNVDLLQRLFLQHLPEGTPLYPADYVTDQPERLMVSEIVREQVLRMTHDELPFSTAVLIDRYEETGGLAQIYCTILVERDSQKPIVLGRAGGMIKQIGTAARLELEAYLQQKVYLDLHVKVRSEWRDDERLLDEIGLQPPDDQS